MSYIQSKNRISGTSCCSSSSSTTPRPAKGGVLLAEPQHHSSFSFSTSTRQLTVTRKQFGLVPDCSSVKVHSSVRSTGKRPCATRDPGCDACGLKPPGLHSPKKRQSSHASSNCSMNSSPQAMSYSSIGGPNKPGDQKNFGPEKPVVDKADVSSSHAGDSIKVEDSGSRSSPASYGTQQAVQLGTPHEKMKKENDQDSGKASPVDHKHGSGGSGGEQRKSSRAKPGGTAESQGIYLQPQTHEITDEQLVNEVRGIYAGLVMVEKKCIEIDKQQSESPNKLSDLQWQALISLHRTLLHEHHDFFLASQHPSASRVLKRLPEKYAMPARMWRYGIHSFLELLRHRLPDSLEHTLTFLYLAYSMMTLLLESVPEFRETWIECLGDLARYRMAVEDVDMRDREAWAGVARYWYHQAADKNQSVGRIQHHLAVLARPDMLQQLFYYTKSLVSVHPFPSAGESIMLLFHPLLSAPKPFNQPIVASAFVTAHGYLFTQSSSPTGLDVTGLVTQTREFLQHLDMYIGRLSAAFRLHGVYMSLSNFAAIFQYGAADAVIPSEFNQDAEQPADVNHTASEKWTPVENVDAVEEDFVKSRTEPSSLLIFYGSFLTFQTLSAILGHVGNKNVYPAVHTSLAFLWCMALNGTSMMHIEVAVPWQKITTFLNTLIRSETDLQPVASDDFPIIEEKKHIPEDFLIRGQLWSQQYYPKGFFEEAPTEDDGRSIEYPSLSITRTYRCLWLGARLAKFNRWITYNPNSPAKFSHTPFATELENIAQRLDTLAEPDNAQSDVEMS